MVLDQERGSPFSYTCNACNRCCYGKAIRVGPYEVVRLARNRGLSTTEFLAHYTEAGGTTLRVRPDGACVFLGPEGCGVHPDRPLACRLYPLGRKVEADGEERFGHLPPHPQTAGVYGTQGTVGDYLRAQGVERYFEASDRYAALYVRMVALLSQLADGGGATAPASADEAEVAPWLDVDAAVAIYCREHGLASPTTVDETIALHIRAVDAWLERLAASGPCSHRGGAEQ